ncbi:hypothetical protein C5C36_13595 [Rathayibacter sp. AY1G1]|jgi:hypothetical protein|uniref:hypothetical protein n=1 Tax=unclassified Rathayibacter TaxID=2609250 RepID=UPI000CE8C223
MSEQQQTTPDPAATYQAAVAAFAATLSDPAVTEAIAPTLPCWRATGIIDLLTQAGHTDAAEKWAELHAWSPVNDEHDPHRGDRWDD